MITLKCPHSPRALGDTIDALFLAHMISRIENDIVNIKISHPDEMLLNDLVKFARVIIGKETTDNVMSFDINTAEGVKLYHKYSSQVKKIPKTTIQINKSFELPDNFITAQWDAQQIYRRVDKYDKDKTSQIENFYKDMGYDIIRIGGEGEYKKLDDIIYVMTKAKMHIGAGSGMAHIAKFIMDTSNIHYYHNVQRRENDNRFPDGWDVTWMGREMIRRGMKFNYWKPNLEHNEYFKDVSLYHAQ